MATADKPKYHDEAWLREQYWEKGRTLEEMAEVCGVVYQTISRHMEEHGIKKREIGRNSTGDIGKLRNESWLKEKYIDERMSTYGIANLIDVSRRTVSRWIDRHGIEKRSHSLACASSESIKKLWDESWLYQRYVVEGKSTVEIASLCGTDDSTVGQWLDRHGIETRSHSVNTATSESVKKLWDREWLYQRYVVENKSTYEIAPLCDVHSTTVWQWLRRHDIALRDRDPPVLTGEDNPNWKGGERFDYGDGWDDAKRRQVRIRDQARCQDCGMTEAEHVVIHNTSLHVHHITPARDFDDAKPRNALSNLITLCVRCHNSWEKIAPLQPDTRAD